MAKLNKITKKISSRNFVKGQKKGMFFTFIALMVLGLMVIIFTPPRQVTLKDRIPTINDRVSAMNSYVGKLDSVYLSRILYVSSNRAFYALIFYMNETTGFLDDVKANFTEVIVNGTINGQDIDGIIHKDVMKNNDLTYRLEQLRNITRKTSNLNVNFTINDVKIEQTDLTGPWQIGIILNISYIIDGKIAKWNRTTEIKTKVSILDLEDPYYMINTNGLYLNMIKKAEINITEWNVTTLEQHILNHTYKKEVMAPSFLMRLENITSNSSCCGIESVLHPATFNLPDTCNSYVDYCYWGNSSYCNITGIPKNIYNITGITSDTFPFKLDLYHVGTYNVTGQAVKSGCS